MQRIICAFMILFAVGLANAQTTGSDGLPAVPPVDQLDGEAVERVTLLLSAHHELPAAEMFAEAAADAETVLYAIAGDAGTFQHHRNRAYGALGYWADADLQRFYATQFELALASEHESTYFSSHHLVGLIGRHFPEAAPNLIGDLLHSEDVQIRLSAVEALRTADSEHARGLLIEAYPVETNATVREAIQRGLLTVR